jgi:hypothetical protein
MLEPRAVIDAALFMGLLLSFWLELTGVPLHQWLGVALGVGAGYHLLTHWTWVKSVTNRFFKQTSGQARLYYVIDTAVLIGLATITVTGLVISTWLNLSLTNFSAWKTVHVIASIGTLSVVVAKIGLHWRWVVTTARRYIFTTAVAPARQSQPASTMPAASGLGRREFLRLMGGVSVVAVIAAGSALDALAQTASPTSSSGADSAQNGTTTTQQQTVSTCVARCPKGCSYPGQCRRYTDSNNNGRCDLGECV